MGAQRLGGVLDQGQAVAAGNVQKAGHVRHVAEHVHHAQRLDMGAGFVVIELAVAQRAAVGAEILHRVRVDAQRVVAADEHRLGAHIAGQRVDGGDKGQRGHDDLVAGADARGHSGQVQRRAAGVCGHRLGHAHIIGDGLLKLGNAGAAGGHPAGQHRRAGGVGLFFAEIGDGKGDKFTHGVLPSQAAGGAAGRRAADRIVLQKYRSPAPPGGAEGYTQSIIPCPQANGKCGGPPCRPKPTKYARPAGGGQPDGRKRMR